MTYLSAYPAYDIVDGGCDALFTKSVDWSYEAEWRLIAEERAFAQSSLTEKTDEFPEYTSRRAEVSDNRLSNRQIDSEAHSKSY